MNSQLSSSLISIRILVFILLVIASAVLSLMASDAPEFSARSTFNSVAVDDFYVFEKNPLYIGRNDQSPESVATLVTGPTYGILVNNGQTVSYSPNGTPGVFVDTFSYKWCELVDPPYS